MDNSKEGLFALMLHCIEQISSSQPVEKKMHSSLTAICGYFRCKSGFIYHTDGFRFFYLKNAVGNENKSLHRKLAIKDMKHLFAAREPVYVRKNAGNTGKEHEILDLFSAGSLWINPIKDMNGVIVGFIGFAGSEDHTPCQEDELQAIAQISSLLAREVLLLEYRKRELRTGKTLESIMNNMGVDIYVNSFDNHDMLYANSSMAAPYGGIRNFKGKKCWQALYTDKTGECDFCPKRHLIDEDGNPTKLYSWDYQRPMDGAWFRVFSAAFEWIDGQMAHVVTSVDITNQKNIEAQLVQAKERAENMDRLKSAFLANMSHEIRTPLNAIVGFSGLLEKEDIREKRARYNLIVQQSNQLLLQLISDILDFSKIEAGILDFRIDDVDVHALCDEIISSYEVRETKGIPVIFDRRSPVYHIRSDKKRLMQVITNLLNNSLKFTAEGQIVLGYRLVGGNIEFRIEDTGIGIAPDQLDKVFVRFMQLNDFAKGSGLGLSICKSIVEQLGGSIGVESEPGAGSQFWFTLPYNEE
jgi:signal transduction histidine kinase